MNFTPKVKNKSTNTKAVVSFLFLLIVHKAKKSSSKKSFVWVNKDPTNDNLTSIGWALSSWNKHKNTSNSLPVFSLLPKSNLKHPMRVGFVTLRAAARLLWGAREISRSLSTVCAYGDICFPEYVFQSMYNRWTALHWYGPGPGLFMKLPLKVLVLNISMKSHCHLKSCCLL